MTISNSSRRCTTPARKRLFVERLFTLWQEHAPEQRFGQLILNASYPSLFHVEDFDLLDALEHVHQQKKSEEPTS